GLHTILLREEPLGIVVPQEHPWSRVAALDWADLKREPLVVLARREGVGLHDAVLAGCRQAGFTPRIVRTPSLIGTVLRYVEAGAGLGVVTDSVGAAEGALRFVPLKPQVTVPLVLVWQEDADTPSLQRFRERVLAWQRDGRLWEGVAPASDSAGRSS
ncbi:MAG: hypothetical protein RLZZ399_2766, partial [Verrucomicrobiota bacterium]